jgi:hypothetical protein
MQPITADVHKPPGRMIQLPVAMALNPFIHGAGAEECDQKDHEPGSEISDPSEKAPRARADRLVVC